MAMGQHRPHYHRFEFRDPLCDLGTPGCSVEAAYDALLRHALPGRRHAGRLSSTNKCHRYRSKAWCPVAESTDFIGSRQRLRSSIIPRMTICSDTASLCNVQIVEENGKIYVQTFGEGNNVFR